jgi:predicted 2-oxoglutarate/Fe(II)-dependent dioxygenase YbiX
MLVVDDFFDGPFCRLVRERMDAGEAEPAEILRHGTGVDVTVRRAGSVDVDEATLTCVEAHLDEVRANVARAFRARLHGREGANFLRYDAGGFYLPHVDRADDPAWPDAARRQIALVVFLNDDFDGGALHIIDARRILEPRRGRLVAFDAGLLHEVEPVTAGIRDVVVDWFY